MQYPYRHLKRIAVALTLLLTVSSLMAGCGGPEVPDVTGMSQVEAVRTLQDAGYELGDINSVYVGDVPKGFVAATDPPAGTAAREGTKVALSVNLGDSAEIVVPKLVGLGQTAAEEDLTSIDLVPVPVEAYSDTVAAGQVIAQVPEPGAKVAANAQVVIQVSEGAAPKMVTVPDVSGQSQSAAEDALEKAGLDAEVYKVYSDSVAKGKVIGQSPSAGAKVEAGTAVGVAVSLGKGTGAVTVPNVVGKKEADAVKAMESAGLKPKVYKEYSDTVAKGVAIAQLPAAGATAASGGEVAISVSLGASGSIAVPDVTGQAEAEVKTALEQAGFVVQVVSQASAEPAGTVSAQLPVMGSTAPAGSTVVIAVSTGP